MDIGVTYAPAGHKLVSYHGITVTVPRSFGVGPIICSGPSTNWVAPDTGEVASCPNQSSSRIGPRAPHHSGVPPVTLVSLRPNIEADATARNAKSVLIDGKPGLRGTLADAGGGWPGSFLFLADPGVDVVVTGPDATLTAAILDSVRVTPIDHFGCRDRVSGFTPTGNAASATMLPYGAAGGDVCEYAPYLGGGIWLVGSAALTPKALHHLIALITTYKASVPALRRPPTTPFAWYLLNHPDMPRRTIAGTLDMLPATISDGTRTTTLASALSSPLSTSDLLPSAFPTP